MVCQCSVPDGFPQPDTSVLHPAKPLHPAKAMTPAQRRQLALDALAETETVSGLARQHVVSRKFVYCQAAKAEEALDAAFSPAEPDDQKVLFQLREALLGILVERAGLLGQVFLVLGRGFRVDGLFSEDLSVLD